MTQQKIPNQPLEKIALSLSGGGYRATSFHLGTLSYLNQVNFQGAALLTKVEMMSSVSGGTITAAVYALMTKDKGTFDNFYKFLLGKLQTIDLVKTGIEKLNPESSLKNPKKAKNLINAFAEQYDEEFTGGATLKNLTDMNSHLKYVVFNATEFTNAINFRFKNPQTFSYSGNKKIPLDNKIATEIKLSDVIASSSCFPGGFEPMLWPDDFVHDNSPFLYSYAKHRQSENISAIGIMDGGIYDNQGIDSILNYKKTNATPYFDLVIISDVSSPDMLPYIPYKEKPNKSWFQSLTLKDFKRKAILFNAKLNWILLITFVILSSIALILYNAGFKIWTGCLIVILIEICAVFFLKNKLVNFIQTLPTKLSEILSKKIPTFYYSRINKFKVDELSIHRILPLVVNRLFSLITLLSNVFLKVVRRLNYYKLYDDENYEYRRISTLVKELTEIDWNKHPKGEYNLLIGEKIKVVSDVAANVATALWFTDEQNLDKVLKNLVACGQFTMCYNLVSYLYQLINVENNGFSNLSDSSQAEIVALYNSCKMDWDKFRENPFFLYGLKV